MLVTLRVLLDHHEGPRAYERQIIDWVLPLPAPGELVALGPRLMTSEVVRRVFVPDGERVMLVFRAGPTDSTTWPAALESAGYHRADDLDDLR